MPRSDKPPSSLKPSTAGVRVLLKVSSSSLELHLEGFLRVLPNFILKVLMPRVVIQSSLYGVRLNSHSIWSSLPALGWLHRIRLGVNLILSLLSLSSSKFEKISHWWHVFRSPRALNPNPQVLELRIQRIMACNVWRQRFDDEHGQIGVVNLKTSFFGMSSLKKWWNK
jgi:hypothetical protein